jgi:exopolyphosphatase/guanosine-5'-triphosphate,3'-diphosphate pyrophosphatase
VTGAHDDSSRPHRSGQPNGQRGDGIDREGPAYAALDLGTNNCRLLVARPTRRGFRVIDAFSRIIRLGEGVTRSGALSDAAMDRTIDALRVCASKVARHRVQRGRYVATEACRIAGNTDVFLARVRRDVGLDIEILSREDEATLAVSGCATLVDTRADLALVFDIGGGSSEIIWLDLTRLDAKRAGHGDLRQAVLAWTSLPVGVVTLAEQFQARFVDAALFQRMVDYVDTLIQPFEARARLTERMAGRAVHMLGTSGTVTTVAGVHLGLPRYDRNRVDGTWMATRDVRTVTARLVGYTHEQRIAEPCIGRERADLVLAGCAILEALMRMWPCERLRVADRGLREGILATLMAEDGFMRGRLT